MSRRWTNEELIAAGKGWAEKHGELRFDDWRRTAPDHPSGELVRTRFGSWAEFVVRCGMTPLRKGFPRKPKTEPPLPFEPPQLTEAERRLADRLRT